MKTRASRLLASFAIASLMSLCASAATEPQVASGFQLGNSAVIKADGTLWIWGPAFSAGIGDAGPGTLRPYPVQVGTSTDWVRVSVGAGGSLALRKDGTLWGWGSNFQGRIGDGTMVTRPLPVQVGTDSDWAVVSAGASHSVAVKTDGSLWAWGANSNAEVGDGTTVTRLAPVRIGTANDWVDVAAGQSHSLARKADGTLWGWGSNNRGQVDGTTAPRPVPTQVGTDTDWLQLGPALNHSVALKTNGQVWGWGAGGPALMTFASILPVSRIGADSDWIAISAGQLNTLAIKANGSLWAWGITVGLGQGPISSAPLLPLQIGTDTNWVKVGGRGTTLIAMKSDGSVWTWGNDSQGQIGDGTSSTLIEPKAFPAFTTWKQISLVAGRSGAIASDGTLWAWPSTNNGNQPDHLTQATPVFNDWTSIAVGGSVAVGLRANGTLWSIPQPGVLPPEIAQVTVSQIGTDVNWSAVACHGAHALALKADGSMWSWGTNSSGQLGDGTTISHATPAQIGAPFSWIYIAADSSNSAAIRADGTVWAWGANFQGQVGDGTTVNRSVPTQVLLPAGVVFDKVAVGVNFMFATTSDGDRWVWGNNATGQYGNGSVVSSRVPILVERNPFVEVAAASVSAFGRKADGTIWGWGGNSSAGIGLGGFTNVLTPTQIRDGVFQSLAINGGQNAAIRVDGSAIIWGQPSGVGFLAPVQVWSPVRARVNAYAPSSALTGTSLSQSYVVDMGLTPVGSVSAPTTLTLAASSVPIVVSSITATAPFSVSHDCPLNAALTSCTLNLTYAPAVPGAFNGQLVVVTGADVGSAPVPLVGQGFFDFVPDPFDIPAAVDVAIASVVQSTPVRPTGYFSPASISISGGQFCVSSSLGCACDVRPSSPSASTISPGQSFCVQLNSAAAPVSSTTATVLISGVGATFVASTARAPTTTALASSLNPAMVNQSVTLTAAVSGAFGPPSGSIAFLDGGSSLGVATLASGQATLTTSALAVGAHVMAASYAGDTLYLPSSSASLVQGITTGNSTTLGTVLDFNHDGKEDVLVPSGNNATLYLMDGSTVVGTVDIAGPGTGWTLTNVADFNGDGKSDLVWQRNAGEVELWLMDGLTPFLKQRLIGLPPGGVVTSIGDFDGDGKSDLLITAATGEVDLWLMDGVMPKASAMLASSTAGLSAMQVGDLDGDGKTDILWLSSDGRILLWIMNGLVASSITELVPPTPPASAAAATPMGAPMTDDKKAKWTVRAMGDFNGDGRKDLVLTERKGQTIIITMNGAQILASAEVAPAKTEINAVHALDLDGDGKDDLVIEFKDGTVEGRLMDGVVVKSRAPLPQNAKKAAILRTGDLNGDHKSDIVWQGRSDAGAAEDIKAKDSITVWIMDGLAVRSSQVLAK